MLASYEQELFSRAIAVPSRVDNKTIDHIETLLQDCKRQQDAFGVKAVLYTVIAQRELVEFLLDECIDDALWQVFAAERAGIAYAIDGQYKECM